MIPHLVLKTRDSFCSLSSNIEPTCLYFYSHLLIHFSLFIFLLNLSTTILYKLYPLLIWHIIKLDSFIIYYFNPFYETFNPQFVNVSYIAWLFYHKFSIFYLHSSNISLLLYKPPSISLPLIVYFSLFSLPDGFLIRILFWIFLAT